MENSFVTLWEKAYLLTIGNIKGYQKRLMELETWNKPMNSKENDPLKLWHEWSCKCQALRNLINNNVIVYI